MYLRGTFEVPDRYLAGPRLSVAIEAMRSSQDRHQYQQEYRERFAVVYSAAIRVAVRNADPAAFITQHGVDPRPRLRLDVAHGGRRPRHPVQRGSGAPVFENLAGRRLAGLLEKIPAAPAVENAQLAPHVLATASNLPLDGGDLAASTASAERRARLIGRLALRGGMPETVERAIADIAAALYRSFSPDDAGPLLGRAATHADVLLVTLVPGADDQIAWLRAGPGRQTRSGIQEIGGTVQQLITSLARDGLPPLARPDAVSGFAVVLPGEAFEGLADDAPLLIVPLGSLWALPWPALPVGEAFLGERFTLAVAPSLTLADQVRRSGNCPGRARSGSGAARRSATTNWSPSMTTHGSRWRASGPPTRHWRRLPRGRDTTWSSSRGMAGRCPE